MDDQELNLNYPVLPNKLVDLEIKIKKAIRATSLNKKHDREIERYSDRYILAEDHSELMKTINIELMGPELVKIYGSSFNKDIDELKAEVDDNSNEEEEQAEEESLEGGDDYDAWYNDEGELVDEATFEDDKNVM